MTSKELKPSGASAQARAEPAVSVADKTRELGRRCCSVVAPPPKLTVSEWAGARRMLPKSSAEPGKWNNDRTPYLREPMDACSDPAVHKVILIFASQTGKSECLNNIAGYHIDYDPANILLIQPTVEMAEAYSKDRIAPMIEDTPTLAEKVGDPRSRNSNNTIQRKEFPGGSISMIGANAPSPLASRFIRVVLADEVDRFPISAGTEGDPLRLAEVRQTTFWNALTVVTSTPTVKGASRIEAEYESSTQEEWHIACPSCGELQPYEWGRLQFDSAEMCCEKCGCLHSEFEWKAGAGQWVSQQPEYKGVRGFRLNAMASPWLSWTQLITEFIEAKAKGPEVLKTFINTRLAECWEESGESLQESDLAARRHYYDGDIPDGVRFITAGVDVQQDRLEVEVVGWGAGKESWGIEYQILMGDPHKTDVWNKLDEVIQRTYIRSSESSARNGERLPVSTVAVDSGYATTSVYAYTRPRLARNVFAIKGMGGVGRPVVAKQRKVGKRANTWMYPVGTDATKDLILTRLNVEEPGPGYCHFPREDQFDDDRPRGYDEDYFKGLTGEHRVERKNQGVVYKTWRKKSSHTRNEPLDCRVYATAALEIAQAPLDGRGVIRRKPAAGAGRQATGSSPDSKPDLKAPLRKPQGRRVLSKGVE
jgi:phage terminase large subunit GpA-like protein